MVKLIIFLLIKDTGKKMVQLFGLKQILIQLEIKKVKLSIK